MPITKKEILALGATLFGEERMKVSIRSRSSASFRFVFKHGLNFYRTTTKRGSRLHDSWSIALYAPSLEVLAEKMKAYKLASEKKAV